MRTPRIVFAALVSLCLLVPTTSARAETVGETYTASLEILDAPAPNFPQRTTNMERWSTGIAVTAGSVIEARVTNNQSVNVSLMSQASNTDVQQGLPTNGTWATITAKADSAFFFKLADDRSWSAQPQVEYRVKSGTIFDMPEYRFGDNQANFVADFETTKSPFAVIIDDAATVLLPASDLEALKKFGSDDGRDFDDVISGFRSVRENYEKWVGADGSELHDGGDHTLFVRPDRTGSGYLYYSPGHYIGTNSPSVMAYLSPPQSWGTVHEIGHGYDGWMINNKDDKDVSLGEVWNNVYAYHYQNDVAGKPQWIYGDGKDPLRTQIDKARAEAGADYSINNRGYRDRLDFVLRMTDRTGLDGFAKFNRLVREQQAAGVDVAGKRRNDVLNRYLGAANGFNFTAWIESNGMTLAEADRRAVMDGSQTPLAMPLADIANAPGSAAAIAEQLDLDSAHRLVTPAELKSTGKTTSVEVSTPDEDAAGVEGRKVSLYDGKNRVAQAPFVDGKATFDNVGIGTYTVQYPFNQNNVMPESDWLVASETGADVEIDYRNGPQRNRAGGVDFTFNGIGDWLFMQANYNHSDKSMTVFDRMTVAHDYFADTYAALKVVGPNGNTIFERDVKGAVASQGPRDNKFDVPVGSKITITHKEGQGRLLPIDALTGTRDARLNVRAGQQVTEYLVTKYGIERVDTPGTALPAYAKSLESEARALIERAQTEPDGNHAVEASALIAAVNTLPPNEQIQAIMSYGIWLDFMLQSSRN